MQPGSMVSNKTKASDVVVFMLALFVPDSTFEQRDRGSCTIADIHLGMG